MAKVDETPMDALEDQQTAGDEQNPSLAEGMLLDYISGAPKKETPKELVRQRMARAFFHEYAISPDDMAADFPIKVANRRKKIDIALFQPNSPKTDENVRRVVVCRPEPTNGKKSAFTMRDHEQAKDDLEELKAFMEELEGCKYGLWTNGLEFFFLRKEVTRFDVRFEPVGDWPMADETIGTRDVVSDARMRRADPAMLRTTFRRCHNFIHGNEGMPKDVAFWQFLYLIFSKMYDERQPGASRRFWAGPTEQFHQVGRNEIRKRVIPLFDDVKKKYATVFRGTEEITLSDRALAFMVSELAKYDFGRTDVDAKGAAYQEIVGTNLRGDKGQYFTPRGAIKLMVDVLDPKPHERVLDPACGTGGFLVATIAHLLERFRADDRVVSGAESTAELRSIQERIGTFVSANLFGADFDQFLVRAAQMNVIMGSNAMANLYHLDALEFPHGYLTGVKEAQRNVALASVDVVVTNPPFGSDIPITDPNILGQFELAQVWERTPDRSFRATGRRHNVVAPEVLFIERCIQWLKPGGRMGIVLPDGILGNPATEYIRWWIMRHTWVLASVDLPVECFIVEANVNILTSLLFFKKKTDDEIRAEDLRGPSEYPVFMAVAENVGYDRRGAVLHKKSPDGEDLIETVQEKERVRLNGVFVERVLRRDQKIIDNDLPLISGAYREFRAKHREPGA